MKKGISLYFGFYLPIEKRVELIKSAGFDCVISNADKKFNDNSKRKFLLQCKLIKKNKLRFSSLHMSYSIKELPYFWKNTKLGHKLEIESNEGEYTKVKFIFDDNLFYSEVCNKE